MLEGKGKIKEADMAMEMQIEAMKYASKALDVYDVLDCSSIAAHIKKVYCYLPHSNLHFFFFFFILIYFE